MLRKNASGLKEPMNMPSSAPATPTKKADTTKATARSVPTAMPSARAAVSCSRDARSRSPMAERCSAQAATIATSAQASATSAVVVVGMPVTPAVPCVTCCQFFATTFTITSTANVASPAVRPERRASGTARRSATPAEIAPAASDAGSGSRCTPASAPGRSGRTNSFVSGGMTRIAPAYAPIAMKAACPNEKTPERPTNM